VTVEEPLPRSRHLTVLSAAIPAQQRAWLDLWMRWPEREPAAHPGYLAALASPDERPMCAVLDLGDGGIIYPFQMRDIDLAAGLSGGYRDITGPVFGYTGAFKWNTGDDIADTFWSEFAVWARQERIVSSFVRLSLFEHDLLAFDGRVRVVQPNVVRDLQHPEDVLWRDMDQKVRKNVRRARDEGVVIVSDTNWEHLDAFVQIYLSTMERRNAAPRYRFALGFFGELLSAVPDSVQLYLARVGSTFISAELILTSTHHAYSFLGGTLDDAFPLRPNDLLKYEIILALREQGLTDFVLGGGPQPGDGIFRYKRSFAPGGVVDFKVGEKIFDSEVYGALVRHRAALSETQGSPWTPSPEFFPAYRAG